MLLPILSIFQKSLICKHKFDVSASKHRTLQTDVKIELIKYLITGIY